MPKKNKTFTSKKKLFILDAISFALGFQAALIAYVTSTYLKENTGMGSVGFFYFLAYAASLFVLLHTHHLVKQYGKSNIYLLFMGLKLCSLYGVAIFSHSIAGSIFALLVLFSGQLMWTALDIIIESFSKDSVTGTIRGKHLAITNAGWLFAPALAARLAEGGGYRWVFLISAVFVTAVFLVSLRYLRNINHNIKKDLCLMDVLRKIFRRSNVAKIYYVSLTLEVFYAVMVVYTPIYLLSLGYDWIAIGKIFTVMLVPFVILQYPIGVIADRKTGEKEWMMVAMVLMGIFTAFVAFMGKATIISWMVILFFTRIGAAIIEVLRDSYFYKQIQPSDVDLIDFFRTTRSISYIIATAACTVLIFFIELPMLFLVLAVFVLIALVPMYNMKDTR